AGRFSTPLACGSLRAASGRLLGAGEPAQRARAAAQAEGGEALLAHALGEVRAEQPEVAGEHVAPRGIEAGEGARRLRELWVECLGVMPALVVLAGAQVDQARPRRDRLDVEVGVALPVEVEVAQVEDPPPLDRLGEQRRIEARLLREQ